MKVAITGATGLVGSALVRALSARGDEPIVLPRDCTALPPADAVVHLAGAPIAVRWTAARKREMVESRVLGARRLAAAIASASPRPTVLVSASAIGAYGDRGDEVLTEDSTRGSDFLATLVRDWEAAADEARGVRVVQLRFGIVLSRRGGALAKMLPPFRLGVGGRLGAGAQWMSWIALDDLVRVIQFAITTSTLAGQVNAVAPNPVTNVEFSRTLAQALHRPAMFPVPAVALRAIFGEMARQTLLASQRVSPAKLERAGFRFDHPTLDSALRSALA